MAKPTTDKAKTAASQPENPLTTKAVVAPIVGWLIPGAGHMIQRRWIRGGLLFISIVAMFLLGLAMQGRIYKANGGDILEILGFIGSHVVDKLRAYGHEPVIYDLRESPWHTDDPVETVIGAVTDRAALQRALEGCDAVAHLAAVAEGDMIQVLWAMEQALEDLDVAPNQGRGTDGFSAHLRETVSTAAAV